jgi:ABC-type transporter MlaC component
MRNGPVLGESGRPCAARTVVDRDFDIPVATKLAVGASWANLSRAAATDRGLWHYVAATYADQFDSYSSQQVQVTGSSLAG